ncbi:MAG: T9SS type A sorting domain-containing protein, partial [Flavobacteriales bacterium]
TGQYVYQVTGLPPCTNPTATVTVLPGPPSNAGVGSSALYCFNEELANLSDNVTGEDITGIWYGPDGSGITFYDQPVDVSVYGAGTYTYVVTTSPCPSDTAFVVVSLDGPPCTIGIQSLAGFSDKMLVMPNPANDHVMIEIERLQPGKGQYISFTDVSGKVVLRQAVQASGTSIRQTVDISSLAAGAYVIDLVGGNTPTQRLMVR